MDSYRSEEWQERNKREEKKQKGQGKQEIKKITKSRLIEENTNMDPSKEVFCNSAKSHHRIDRLFRFAFRVGEGGLMTIFQFESNIYFQQLIPFPKTQHTGTLERETDAKGPPGSHSHPIII